MCKGLCFPQFHLDTTVKLQASSLFSSLSNDWQLKHNTANQLYYNKKCFVKEMEFWQMLEHAWNSKTR